MAIVQQKSRVRGQIRHHLFQAVCERAILQDMCISGGQKRDSRIPCNMDMGLVPLDAARIDGDVTMLKHVFINLNPCCVQWYKFRVHRGKGSGDTVTQIYPFAPNHKTWLISLAHSSISDGGVTTLLHTLINFNPCCIQRYKSHVHRS